MFLLNSISLNLMSGPSGNVNTESLQLIWRNCMGEEAKIVLTSTGTRKPKEVQ